MDLLTVLFNRQIMRYLGANALVIYGPIVNISTFVQCCAYSVGQAAQPIISVNFGAGRGGRIRKTLRLSLWTCAFFGAEYGCPEPLRAHFYESHTADGAGHCAYLCALFSASAV